MFFDKNEVLGKNEVETKKIQSGRKIIKELQRTFGFMESGIKSYVKPTELMNVIVDDNGKALVAGE
jgi:exoribonuclease II